MTETITAAHHNDHHDHQQPSPVDTAPVEAPKPARRAASRRSGRRRSAAGIDKGTVVKVLETRTQVESMTWEMRNIVAAVSGSANDADALTVALLGDTSWIPGLVTVRQLADLEPFDALVEIADMKDDARNDAWAVLHNLTGGTAEKPRLNPAIGKAAKQVTSAVANLSDDVLVDVGRILDVVSE